MGIIWASMGCRRDLSALATIRDSRSRRLTETIFCLNRVTFIAGFTRSKILCRNRTGNRGKQRPAERLRQGKGEGGRGKGKAARWRANTFNYSRQGGSRSQERGLGKRNIKSDFSTKS